MKEIVEKHKKLVIACGSVIAVFVLLTIVAPYMILQLDKQEKVAEKYAYSDVFYTEYDQVREHLMKSVEEMNTKGIVAELYSYAIDEADGLYIDTIYVASKSEQKNLIILTTGVHGIEGYVGSAMLDVFWEEVYPEINMEDTGVLVIANVNPYGMKYKRRYNENNVDLNRNFILDWDSFDLAVNEDYPQVNEFLAPKKQMGNIFWHEVGFYGSMIKEVVANGVDTISNALLGGQYEYAEGVYYGGIGDQASTVYLKDVFGKTLESSYENIVHIDIHSGYGQRYRMVIFNSQFETMNEEETREAFAYDNIIAYDSEAFYPTTGDTTDYFYRLEEQMDTDKTLFSTCFEFGTIGDGFWDTVQSMKYTVEENQNHWHPSKNGITNEVIKERYYELFYPTEMEWREKAVADFVEGCQGVLNAKLISD